MKNKFRLFWSFTLFSIIFSSCQENEPAPNVDFNISKTSANVNESIMFTNLSTNASSYIWDFGDGNSSTSENPTHTYSSSGAFTITLMANGAGGDNSASKVISVSFPAPISDFEILNTSPSPEESILFKNLSEFATSYNWDFGDGSSSTEEHPYHTFSEAGTFQIELTAKGDGGESITSKSITVSTPTYNGLTTAQFNSEIEYGTMMDQEGNVYKTVKIGSQTWMAENLRTSKYNDGAPIPLIINDDEWERTTSGGYSNYNHSNNPSDVATYGRLYNGYAVSSGKLAPEGWHIPTDEEWQELANKSWGLDEAGGRLKEIGTTHWDWPNTSAGNQTGFTALPGGERVANGSFRDKGIYGRWWSSTVIETERNSYWEMFYSGSELNKYASFYFVGYSVRLVKD